MAYVGYTERLCQAIVSGDVEAIESFLADKDASPDRRDYTGRTPLQLACISSTPEVVQCLVDHGARLIARMADGKTALHLAAARGNVDIIRILLTKSNENEEAKKQELKKKSIKGPAKIEDGDDEMPDADDASHTSASYVKIEKDENNGDDANHETIEENEEEPDIFDINATAWDSLASPLQLAILHGHTDVVTELVSSFGADILMPIKILNDWNGQPKASILNLVLVLALPLDKARSMSQTLLKLGASPAQADLTQSTPLHYIAQSSYSDLLDVYLEHDGPALQRAINHLALTSDRFFSTDRIFFSALMNAIATQNHTSAKKLLEVGANPKFELEYVMSAIKSQLTGFHNFQHIVDEMKTRMKQPILYAAEKDLPLVAIELLRRGADPNSEEAKAGRATKSMTVLTCVRNSLESKREFLRGDKKEVHRSFMSWNRLAVFEKEDESYLAEYPPASYQKFFATHQLKNAHEVRGKYDERFESQNIAIAEPGLSEKKEAVVRLIHEYELLEKELLARGARTAEELHPDLIQPPTPKPAVQSQENIFKIDFKFRTPVLTDTAREGYLQLYASFRSSLQFTFNC